jgi:hypothetical protein
MVGPDEAAVEQALVTGELKCPKCLGVLRPWFYARWRSVRGFLGKTFRFRPRRSRCRDCFGTHVLLPDTTLLRRAYSMAVILVALNRKAAGAGHRKIAEGLNIPAATVRGWVRRFSVNARYWRVLFTGLRDILDSEPDPIQPRISELADAVEVISLAGEVAVGSEAWTGLVSGFVAVSSAGLLLAPNPGPGLVRARGSPGVIS